MQRAKGVQIDVVYSCDVSSAAFHFESEIAIPWADIEHAPSG